MIKFTDDVVPPMVIAGADILTEKYQPAANRWVGVGLAALGYIAGGWMGMGGNFVKNLGIAAAPWAYESIYLWITEGMTTRAPAPASVNRMVMRPGTQVGSYPAQPKNTQLWPSAV